MQPKVRRTFNALVILTVGLNIMAWIAPVRCVFGNYWDVPDPVPRNRQKPKEPTNSFCCTVDQVLAHSGDAWIGDRTGANSIVDEASPTDFFAPAQLGGQEETIS